MINAPILDAPQASAPPSIYQLRSNMQSSEVVDRGIAVQASFSSICAIEYLKSHNIDPEVIKRVLLHPELRRKGRH
ncbi:hypothetical protein ACFOLJ_21435 [Rugamonas sp. CCM 8940]|uniref:hypothetical protein n=1 Tax=Rugamonas sp. CCM 8940 TaxID=2765359 RepID=UPI0018F6B1A4|nr:hypothetical protein [Rugamonas sp. CCM 8940]MBJ7312615.1 hypothetical protein [Rugamonas sp. CCM 8940]